MISLKILHILHQSLPNHQSGYDIRSHYILKSQQTLGIDARAITGPYCKSFQKQLTIDGVPYYHMSDLSKRLAISALKRLSSGRKIFNKIFSFYLNKIIKVFNPDIIHAHTPWFTSLPALNLANLKNIPYVYEVRGFWEESEIAEGIISRGSDSYRLYLENDNYIMSNADHIIAISSGIRSEIINRGITKNEITVIPNGVDIEKFTPREKDKYLVDSLGISGKIIVGYISSLRKLEGIKTLLDAMQNIDKRVMAIIIGDGPEREGLEKHAHRLGIDDFVRFMGNVPHEDIARYYSIIDIFVVPRVDAKVCHLVTPLKPLEAMAMGKCIVASNVGGLNELIEDGKTGILFKPEDCNDLAHKINNLISNSETRLAIGLNAMEYIRKERNWNDLCKKYIDVYSNLLT